MCLVCMFLMIKKADHVLNNNFLIPSLSLLFRLYPFLFSLPSEQKTKKPNPRSPHLHRRQRRSTAGLYVRRSSSPLSTLQDPTSNRAFVTAESSSHILIQVRIWLSPCLSMGWLMALGPWGVRWNGAGWRELWRWVESSGFTAAGVIFVAVWSLGHENRRE